MNMATVVYLASLSMPLTFVTMLFAFFGFTGIVIAFFMKTDEKINKYSTPLMVVSAITFIICIPICVFYPSEAAIYKMAGITDVQKTQIDANGNVLLQNSTKDSVKVQIGHK